MTSSSASSSSAAAHNNHANSHTHDFDDHDSVSNPLNNPNNPGHHGGYHAEQQASHLPKFIAVPLSLGLGFGVLFCIVLVVIDNLQSFERTKLKIYEESAVLLAARMSNWTRDTFHVDASSLLDRFEDEVITKWDLSDVLQMTVGWLVDSVTLMGLILLFMLYLLPEQVAGADERSLKGKIDLQIQNYIVLKSLISFVAGLCVFIILHIIFKIPMAFLFAFLTFIFNFIPNLGAIIASCLPLPVIILDPDLSGYSKLLAFLLPVLVHLVVGNLIEPTVFGEKLELHPIVVLLSLAFWYAMWGIPGAILSVPITAVLRIILNHVNHPYATILLNMLEGRLFELVPVLSGAGNSSNNVGTDRTEEREKRY